MKNIFIIYLEKIKNYLSNLTLTSSVILTLILCLSIKQPISLLFMLLDVKQYFFLFCGLFSALVTFTKAVGNMETPTNKALYLSIIFGAFVSLFFYLLPCSLLIDVYLNIGLGLGLGVLSFLEKLPKISSLSHNKYYINKNSFSGFKDALRNFFSGNKLLIDGSPNSPLDTPVRKKNTFFSESGNMPDMTGSRYDPEEGSSRGVRRYQEDTHEENYRGEITNEPQTDSRYYAVFGGELKQICFEIMQKKLLKDNPSKETLDNSPYYFSVTMREIVEHTNSTKHHSELKK